MLNLRFCLFEASDLFAISIFIAALWRKRDLLNCHPFSSLCLHKSDWNLVVASLSGLTRLHSGKSLDFLGIYYDKRSSNLVALAKKGIRKHSRSSALSKGFSTMLLDIRDDRKEANQNSQLDVSPPLGDIELAGPFLPTPLWSLYMCA